MIRNLVWLGMLWPLAFVPLLHDPTPVRDPGTIVRTAGTDTTYGDGRYAFLVPYVVDTLTHGSDTTFRVMPNPDSVGTIAYRAVRKPGTGDTAFLVLTYATSANGYAALDSSTVDSIWTAWSLGTPLANNVTVPGQPVEVSQYAAFPSAVGPGALALTDARDSVKAGSWPLQVFKITSLADSGDGTLRAIIEDSISSAAYNIIIPDTFGTITLTGDLRTNTSASNVYLAGQGGPGGIDIRGRGIGVRANNTDWVIRYVRFSEPGLGSGGISLNFMGFHRVYIDHVSMRRAGHLMLSLGVDTSGANCTSAGGFDCDGSHATVAYSMFYDSEWDDSPVCALSTGDPEANVPLHGVLWFQNFFMNCTHRTPLVGGDSIWVVNNILYNIRRSQAGQIENDFRGDVIANYSKRGAWTETADGNSGSWMTTVDYELASEPARSIYHMKNRHVRNTYDTTTAADSVWRGSDRLLAFFATRAGSGATEGDTLPIAWQRTDSLPQVGVPWTRKSPSDTWRDNLLDSLGAFAVVTNTGGWWAVSSGGDNIRDEYDSLRLAQFADSTSPSPLELPADAISAATQRGPVSRTDTDGDGLPDAYETATCASNTCLPADSVSGSGYLAIELWLDGKSFNWSP